MRIETWNITSQSGGFHFGRHGLGQEETAINMPSDSLFAAIISRLAARLGGDVEAFMRPFLEGTPPFALSSTFPFAGKVRFFPVPVAALVATSGDDGAKEFKRVQFVSQGLFLQLLDGAGLKAIYNRAEKLMDGRVLVASDEHNTLPEDIRTGTTPIWSLETRPRVTLGRAAQNASIFFTGRVTYARDCGLWFGVYWLAEADAHKQQFTSLLADLGDSGLGAERSVGFGVCQILPEGSMELPDPKGNPWVSLSRYLPRPDETGALETGAYRIVNVGGWLDSPVLRGQRRRAVNLLEEGATLGSLLRPIPGDIADVRPSYETNRDPLKHPVYRSGQALAVGWKGGML